jgi:hypothetical protein
MVSTENQENINEIKYKREEKSHLGCLFGPLTFPAEIPFLAALTLGSKFSHRLARVREYEENKGDGERTVLRVGRRKRGKEMERKGVGLLCVESREKIGRKGKRKKRKGEGIWK